MFVEPMQAVAIGDGPAGGDQVGMAIGPRYQGAASSGGGQRKYEKRRQDTGGHEDSWAEVDLLGCKLGHSQPGTFMPGSYFWRVGTQAVVRPESSVKCISFPSTRAPSALPQR